MDASVVRLIVKWLILSENSEAIERAVAAKAAATLPESKLADAITAADFLCVDTLRQTLQRRALHMRIRSAEDARRTGENEIDALATLTAFQRSGREFTVLRGLSPSEMQAVGDVARLLQLKPLKLGSEFPRALVVALMGAHVDLKALGQQLAPRTARASKHGAGGRRRRGGGLSNRD